MNCRFEFLRILSYLLILAPSIYERGVNDLCVLVFRWLNELDFHGRHLAQIAHFIVLRRSLMPRRDFEIGRGLTIPLGLLIPTGCLAHRAHRLPLLLLVLLRDLIYS